jgi:type I restriction enzyme S subunit
VDIALPPEHRRLVLNILGANLPESTKVWVFGSRATGRARRYSDLDLAIDAGRPLTLDEIAGLAEAFSDSDLPYKVDLIDWHNIDDHWRQTITAGRVALTEAAHPDGPGRAKPERTLAGSAPLTGSSGSR